LLGPVEALDIGGPVNTGGPKRRTLLAALLLQPNTVVSDGRLIDLVWGEHPPRGARSQLQAHVHGLRKALGAETILRRGHGYRMAVADGEIDADVFARLLARARADRAAGHLHEAVRVLRTALSLWTGPALDGVGPELTAHARPALEETRLHALKELHGTEIDRNRPAEAVPGLRALCAEHPTREHLAALLMSALHADGRTCEALEAYAQLSARLAEELGTDPGPRLQRLHRDLLAATGEDGRARRTHGARWIRPAELPCGVDGFVGRSAELAVLDQSLGSERKRSHPIWLITGVAGVGKTALALHWSHTAREHFRDGQLYVDLRGSAPDRKPLHPDDALRQLLRSLGTEPRHPSAGTAELAKLFRSVTADQSLLFLFDDAASSRQLAPLLPAGHGDTVLVTSRHPLTHLVARVGARPLPLDVLSAESSQELFRSVAEPRARTVGPALVARIASLRGHEPLALRLTAAALAAQDQACGRPRPGPGAMPGVVPEPAPEPALSNTAVG
jgi:DNA-binding SARP family transcriptional activator